MSSGYEAKRLAQKALKLALAAQDMAGEDVTVARQSLSFSLTSMTAFTPNPGPSIFLAAALTPKGSGIYLCSVTFSAALAATDTLTWEAATQQGVTSVTGGAAIGGTPWRVPSAGPSLPAVNGGGAPIAVCGAADIIPAAALTFSKTLSFPAQLTVGQLGAILVEVTETGGNHQLATPTVSLTCQELP
jgi:hypothetical protein